MPSKRRVKAKNKKHHILLFILLIIAAVFFTYRELGKEEIPESILDQSIPQEKPEVLPKIAIVIDDLGSSKKLAKEIFNIKAPLTLSIIPHTPYAVWIAEEGHRLGHDVIEHIPMEPKNPRHKLGKGGLYTWMTDEEIAGSLKENLDSIPHIKGASNHMGSSFTEDERAMSIVISGLKDRRLFFLDSLTTPNSTGIKLARAQGVKTLRRDVFLDGKDTADIETQWKGLVKLAKKRGYAIALAHPRKNTIEFLKKVISTDEIIIVPLSGLTPKMQ